MGHQPHLDHVLFSVDIEEYRSGPSDRLGELATWLSSFGVSSITVDVKGSEAVDRSFTSEGVECEVVSRDGRQEFVEALRSMASEVEEEHLPPSKVDGSALEDRLPDDGDVDLVVKTGEPRLLDAAIYNTVYSEVRFVDSWRALDRHTMEEIVEDFEKTERRYGR